MTNDSYTGTWVAPTRVVVLNGPPNSGKDTLADQLCHQYRDAGYLAERRAFKDGLIELAAKLMLVDEGWFRKVCDDRDQKERAQPQLGGLSPRQALIFVSEDVVKPKLGDNYFGRFMAQNLTEGAIHFVSDGGFLRELVPVMDLVGRDNLLVVHLHREGCTFEGDSRDYVPLTEIRWGGVHDNKGSIEQSAERLDIQIQHWIRNTNN